MTNMLKEEREIERSHEMTAREFQDWLEFKGLPRFPVQKLTNLFEKMNATALNYSRNAGTAIVVRAVPAPLCTNT